MAMLDWVPAFAGMTSLMVEADAVRDHEPRYFFRTGGRSVQVPSNTSATMPIDSPSVGCG